MTASVRSRFVFTVGANLVRSALSFATGMLLARLLGPDSFGRMAFLLGTFLALRQLLDMGSATAFFTFMSQRVRSRRFVNSFCAWLGLQFLIPFCAIGLLFPSEWISAIWHGEQRGLVLMAFAAAFMQNNLWTVMQQAGESQRRTARVQGIAVAVVAAHLLAVMLLWALGKVGLYAVFAVIAAEYLCAAIVVRKTLAHVDAESSGPAGGSEPSFRDYLRYCLPLIPYTWIGFVYEFADRWLLQNYGGSIQQAYYAVSAQFAAVALIATASILNIFWKEVAEAHHKGDHARTGMLYQKVSRLLFLIGAIIAGYLCPWVGDLLQLILGTAYVGGASALAVMFLYPVHQSMGQIGTTMLYATERVSVQVRVGIVFMILSIGVTYVMLASRDAIVPGLGLAAMGLALKMVVLQIVQANLIAYIITRLWNWRFDWVYQPVSLLGCVAMGWLAREAVTGLAGAWPIAVLMGLGGMIYLIMVSAFVYLMPWLTGFRREELLTDAAMLLRKTAPGLRSR